jgi:SAM-dependent methyltransferase
VPIADASIDVVLLSQVLHHATDPLQALKEAARIASPGGRVLILDLREHQEEWVRARLGDRRLGFREQELADLLLGAGLEAPRTRVGSSRAGDPFAVLIAAASKPVTTRAGVSPPRKRKAS